MPTPTPAPSTAPLTLDLGLDLSTGAVPPGVSGGTNGKVPDPRGAEVTVSGHGLMPNSDVVIELHSTPIHLATVRTDALGNFTTKLRLPLLIAAGLHHVVATGTAPDGSVMVASSELIVPLERLPYTGSDTAKLAGVAGLSLLAGSALLLVARRRRQAGAQS